MGVCGSRAVPSPKNVYVDGLLQADVPMDFKINLSNLRGKGLAKVESWLTAEGHPDHHRDCGHGLQDQDDLQHQ